MLDKMISSIATNGILCSSIPPVCSSKKDYIVFAVLQCRILGFLVIYKVYKLNMIIQQIIKVSIFLSLRQINSSNYIKNYKAIIKSQVKFFKCELPVQNARAARFLI